MANPLFLSSKDVNLSN